MAIQEFELTTEEFAQIMEASRSVPYMTNDVGTELFGSPQENANLAWRLLGEKRGFVWDTVRPIPAKGKMFFTAEPKPLWNLAAPAPPVTVAKGTL